MPAGIQSFLHRVESAVSTVAAGLTVQTPQQQPTSHRSFSLSGLEANECVTAIGTYLVGLVAQIVMEDMTILGGTAPSDQDAWSTISQDVELLVGDSNEVPDAFRITRRDPWIAEAIARLLAQVARAQSTGYPSDILALTRVTSSVTRSGLDLVAIYRDSGSLQHLVGEIKTTEDNLNGNLSECYSTLRQVGKGERSLELRATIQSLGLSLHQADRQSLGRLLYERRPLLMPLVSHGPNQHFDLTRNREAVRRSIRVEPAKFRFLICRLEQYRMFFDQVADSMRATAAKFGS